MMHRYGALSVLVLGLGAFAIACMARGESEELDPGSLSNYSSAESTTSCPTGQYDMLDWWTLDSDLRASNHLAGDAAGNSPMYNKVWTNRFDWIKNPAGTVWDLDLFDSHGIYLSATDNWEPVSNPTCGSWIWQKAQVDYAGEKANDRCQAPGTTIYDSGRQILYSSLDSCSGCVAPTGYDYFTTTGPVSLNLGGTVGTQPTLINTHHWGCRADYTCCYGIEEFYLTKRYGWIGWSYKYLATGSCTNYVVANPPGFWSTLVAGGPPAETTCWTVGR
jgi:hypothetical protein